MATTTFDLRDRDAFESAYRALRPRAVAAAQRVLRDRPAAEEVAQEVFVQLWRQPGSFDARRGRLERYVAVLASSRAIDRWRRDAARSAAAERHLQGLRPEALHTQSAADEAVAHERTARLASALRDLPDQQRTALLAFSSGQTASEIAESAGVPLGTAKSRIRLGLDRMRRTLDGELAEVGQG